MIGTFPVVQFRIPSERCVETEKFSTSSSSNAVSIYNPYMTSMRLVQNGNSSLDSDMCISNYLFAGIKVPQKEEVKAYLDRFISEAHQVKNLLGISKNYFPHDAQFSLEINDDIEENSEWLVLYVRLHKYNKLLIDEIDAVNEAFKEQIFPNHSDLVLSTDYQPPLL